jgi:hypothetical protein
MLKNDIDDDDDIINPFNIYFEPDVDIDVELDDQEEDTNFALVDEVCNYIGYVTILGIGELRAMLGGGGDICVSTFMWLALFSRE